VRMGMRQQVVKGPDWWAMRVVGRVVCSSYG
jgi:hypothetical protein